MTQFNSSVLFASILAAGGAVACSAQVGDEYTGEVMWELSGKVELLDESHADRVPALAFFSEEGLQLVRAEVEGSFPTEFRMSVTSPPPDSAILPSGVAVGVIVVVPPNAGGTMPAMQQSYDESENQCEERAGVSVCTRTETRCDDAGRCRQEDLSCTPRACTLLGTTGDPELKPQVEADYRGPSASLRSYDNEHFVTGEYCPDLQDQVNCYREYYHCIFEATPTTRLDFGVNSLIDTCDVLETRTDEGFVDLDTVFGQRYLVVYVPEGAETEALEKAKPKLGLRTGYNLVEDRAPSSPESWLEHVKCDEFQGMREYFRLLGADVIEPSADCPARSFGLQAVPSESALELNLGAPPQNSF